MKFKILFFLLFAYSNFCNAQTTRTLKSNLITKSEFEAITYKGKTIEQIEATQGNEQALHLLFGSYSSKDDSQGSSYVTFNYQSNTVNYDYELNRLVSIVIKDNTWPVVVKGKTIRIGDSIQNLQNKFGSGFQVFTSNYGPEKFTGFTYSVNDYNAVYILISPNTNRVMEITYFLLP